LATCTISRYLFLGNIEDQVVIAAGNRVNAGLASRLTPRPKFRTIGLSGGKTADLTTKTQSSQRLGRKPRAVDRDSGASSWLCGELLVDQTHSGIGLAGRSIDLLPWLSPRKSTGGSEFSFHIRR